MTLPIAEIYALEMAKRDNRIKELEAALSGRTVSCGHCNALADRVVELRSALEEAEKALDSALPVTAKIADALTKLRAIRGEKV